jgi:hypothetical protein
MPVHPAQMAVLQTQAPPPVSDAGAVAARHGFKYQDHIAAKLVILMLESPDVLRVECETSDDIVVFWREGTGERAEYVQVKTTEGDRKWTIKEVTTRKIKASPTSLLEKSLLCDVNGPSPQFRIVSQRDVAKELQCLKLERRNRSDLAPISALGEKFLKKHKTKSSANGHDLKYWAENAYWEVVGNERDLEAINTNRLVRLAEQSGETPSHQTNLTIYCDLLRVVEEAARASKITDPSKKIISREDALTWWRTHLSTVNVQARNVAKPYRVPDDPFLTEFHYISGSEINRALSGFDAAYDNQRWRSQEFAEHLIGWLPELALSPSELVDITPNNIHRKLSRAISEVKRNAGVDYKSTVADLLLHIVLRHKFNTEPIGAKLFQKGSTGIEPFGNAHILHRNTGDELWLGRSTVATATDYNTTVASVISQLEDSLDSKLLKDEREIILTLREPQHLLPTSLNDALKSNAPVDQLVKVLCIPILIGYDSSVLKGGYRDDYISHLITEVNESYASLSPSLPACLSRVKIHLFFIPIECVETLTKNFAALLG